MNIVHTILRIGIIRALNESAGRLLGPPCSTDKTTLIIKVSKGAKIGNRYNQEPHLTQDTRHRGYPGTGIVEGDFTHNPEDWNNKSIELKCGETF